MESRSAHILLTRGIEYRYPGQAPISFPDIACERGKHLLLSGQSGVGKTTLLHLMSGLLGIQKGSLKIDGTNLADLGQKELDRFRGKNIGLVFQQPVFISSLNVVENICAAQFFGLGRSDQRAAYSLLDELGISQKSKKMTNQLSGGERQRLAIARAIAAQPKIIYADEPTSSLDDTNAMVVYQLLVKEAAATGASLVVVTHDQRLNPYFENKVAL